jgi:hypothetical protein
MPTYEDYSLKKHIEKVRQDPYAIQKIPADELNYEICCAAVTKGAGDCDFFKWFVKKYKKFIDEQLCKIAVSANPKKKFVRSECVDESPEGYKSYENLYKYFDPVLKFVPEEFRTADVCRESAKYDWRTLQFVPRAVQVENLDICETAVKKCNDIMSDDVNFWSSGYERFNTIFAALDKSVFEQHPGILDGEYTLDNVSKEWIMANPDKVKTVLLKQPEHIKKLPKDFRTEHFNVIRDVAGQNDTIWTYLSATEQKGLRDIIRERATQDPKILASLSAPEQKLVIDLVEKALKNGKISLGGVKPSAQMLIKETCVAKLMVDPFERRWYVVSWAREPTPGLNLKYLCADLQKENVELIQKLVREHLEQLEDVKTDVLIEHPEIYTAAIEKWGAMVYEKIPQAVFTKHPDLYEQLFQKCPRILPQLPKKLQTPEKWRALFKIAPVYANSAPRGYITVQDYEIAFTNGAQISLSHIPPRFKTYEICKESLKHHGNYLDKVPSKIKKEHPDVCETALAEYPRQIENVPESVQMENPYLCKMAVTGDPMTLKSVKRSVQRKYPEICRLAMAQLVADFGWMDSAIFPEKLEAEKDTLRSYIPRDVLKEHWDYINNTRDVITIKKSR